MKAKQDKIDPFNYSSGDVLQLLQQHPEKLFSLFTLFSQRYIHIGELGIERNTFINWEKGGLIPYDREEKGWRKFSFLEAVWVKTVEELRALGVSTDTIRVVKESLWAEDQDAFYDQLIRSFNAVPEETPLKAELEAHLKTEGSTAIESGFAQLQISPLMFVVVVSLLRKVTYLLSVNKYEEVLLVPMVSPGAGADESVGRLQRELFSTSATVINLWAIMQGLAFQKEVEVSGEVLLQLLTPEEAQIVQLIQDRGYREVIITKDGEGTPTHIRVKKTGITPEAIKKLVPYLKKGQYTSIEFKTRDGELIQYEETEVIKLKKKEEKKQPQVRVTKKTGVRNNKT